jgi:hypothetical protein
LAAAINISGLFPNLLAVFHAIPHKRVFAMPLPISHSLKSQIHDIPQINAPALDDTILLHNVLCICALSNMSLTKDFFAYSLNHLEITHSHPHLDCIALSATVFNHLVNAFSNDLDDFRFSIP